MGPPGGGTVDKVGPSGSTGLKKFTNTIEHFARDVIPYLLCCKGFIKDCSKYYERRPSDDGSSFVDPPPPGKQSCY